MAFDYHSLAKSQYESHFNPRAAATEVDEKIARMDVRSETVRERYQHTTDLRYGPNPNELLDVFHPTSAEAKPKAPVHLFVHGGYWRAMDKASYSFIAAPIVDAGGCAVIINYDLAPSVSLDEIVAETRRSIAWTYRNIAEYGGDPDRLYISGNSAGGHLVAMALAHDWTADELPCDIIKGATPVTGVMDCEPVLHITVNEEVRLDAEMARRNSPIHHPPRHPLALIVAVGGAEPEGWVELSRSYVRTCEAAGLTPRYMEMPGLDHFDVSAAMGDPDSPLTQAMLEQMRLNSGARIRYTPTDTTAG